MTVDTQAVLNAWRLTTAAVARSPGDFTGRDKEKKVFRRLRQELECLAPELAISEPDSQLHFNRWSIDLVCSRRDSCVAIEGKYKILSDRAVPDNRKAAFFDLYKLVSTWLAVGTQQASSCGSPMSQSTGSRRGAIQLISPLTRAACTARGRLCAQLAREELPCRCRLSCPRVLRSIGNR